MHLPLILASNSPRRKQLLTDAGYSFMVRTSGVDEDFTDETEREEVPKMLATRKANELQSFSNENIIIAADTIVLLGNEIINKPADAAEAINMLSKLSGKQHSVITGVAMLYKTQLHTFSERTEVFFRNLAQQEIETYVNTFRPMDKAGAYGIQEYIGLRGVTRIEGDFYNVMGMPICRLGTELTLFMETIKLSTF